MPQKSIYEYLPSWVLKQVTNKKCKKCNRLIEKDDIIAVGLRDHEGSHTPFVEHKCEKCQTRMMTSFGSSKVSTVEEICYMLLSEMKYKKIISNSKKQRRVPTGEMTDSEIKSFLREFRASDNHDDFMKQIGAQEYQKMLEPKKKADETKD